MHGALGVLTERLHIRFSFKPAQLVEVDGAKSITLHLDRDLVSLAAFDPPDGGCLAGACMLTCACTHPPTHPPRVCRSE